jgi:hypothetical protein
MCEAVAVSVGDDEGRFDLGMPRSSAEHDLFEDRSLGTPK